MEVSHTTFITFYVSPWERYRPDTFRQTDGQGDPYDPFLNFVCSGGNRFLERSSQFGIF